jgi:hypothetical protein
MSGSIVCPEKGDKTRNKIMNKSTITLDELKGKLDTLLGTITRNMRKSGKEGESLVSEGKLNFTMPKVKEKLYC